MEELTGVLEHIIFHNDSNDYTIADFDIDGGMVTVTGTIPEAKEGLYLKLFGTWVNHPTYGEQFKLSYYHLSAPTSAEAIERYLAGGALPGIGEKTAALIVDAFGDKTLEILDHHIDRLLSIPGIGKKTLERLKAEWESGKAVREVIFALQEYGIPTNIAMRLYRAWGNDTVSIMLNDPYRMIRDVSGIGFKMADDIAARMGIDADHPGRIAAGIMQSLRECYAMGSTCMNRRELLDRTQRFIRVPEVAINEGIDTLTIDGDLRMDIIDDEEVFYPAMLFEAEDELAAHFVRLANKKEKDFKGRKKDFDIESEIDAYEEAAGLQLDSGQRDALRRTLTAPIAVITGGPGTGKTTIINGLVMILKRCGQSIALAAPTGRAAKRMSESTGEDAKTIHRLLEYTPIDDDNAEVMRFKRDEENPLHENVIIVDETSMVDILLMSHLVRALSSDTRLILVGDADQLPSVGPGQVLRDFIATGDIPVIRLNTIYRQAKGSSINRIAHAINAGEIPEIPDDGDVRFATKNSADSIGNLILAIVKKCAENKHRELPQVITPMKKGQLGTVNLNALLQKTLNPAAPHKNERAFGTIVFREGDRVMQIKNDYQLHWENPATGQEGEGVYNGDIGDIIRIEPDNSTLVVQMCDDGRVVQYHFEDLGLLTHAWAMTIHKSQGSEFQTVIMPLISGSSEFLTRRLLYTAVTRAKRNLFLLGPWHNFTRMIGSTYDARRKTGLVARIKNYQSLKQYL